MRLKPYLPGNCGRKCRLLYVVGQLGAGGLERQLYLLLKSLDRDRYQPHVVVWNFNPDDTYVSLIKKLGVPLHSFHPSVSQAGKMLSFRRIVRELSPEVIHSYSFYTNIAVSWASIGTRIIAVGGLRSNFINDKSSCGILLGSLCARWPRNQIFNNFAAAKKARRSQSFFSPSKIFVVQNGVDLQEFRNTPLPTNGRAQIVGAGSLIPLKCWDRLLLAAASLKGKTLDFQIEIAGDGPLRESLERHARALGLIDRVKFVGHTNDISGFIAKSTLLAHTSNTEGCPNIVMEAMACGRPVLATDAGDTRSLVEDGITGFIVRRGDDIELTDRLARLVEDRDLCHRMGTLGRNKAEREFGLNRLVEETFAAYHAAGWEES
jgi:glycosyltransferase involved in cell wall biosynthesis